MILLVGGATKTVAKHPEVGCLVQPRAWASMGRVANSGRPWAADNDCFQRLDVEAYWQMITKISRVDRSRFLWVACPDVVGNAQETCNRWFEWFPQLDYLGLLVAFVGQDGIEDIPDQIPWHEMAALFVGGSDKWKLSHAAENLGREAKAKGKWLHVGRVNSRKRIQHCLAMQADSIDGKSYSAWPDRRMPEGLKWIRQAKAQKLLF